MQPGLWEQQQREARRVSTLPGSQWQGGLRETTALHRGFQGQWLLSGFCHKKAKQMFTEMAACIGHFPMTDHTEKNLGCEMAAEEGSTEPRGA